MQVNLDITFSDSGSKVIPQVLNMKQSLKTMQYWGGTTAVIEAALYKANPEGTSDIVTIHR
jgi:hypothetical protein